MLAYQSRLPAVALPDYTIEFFNHNSLAPLVTMRHDMAEVLNKQSAVH